MNTMKKQRVALAATLAGTLLLGACASAPDRKPGDPLEPVNRVVFSFNSHLDSAVAQPVARGYKKITPSPLRLAISNFFANFGDVDTLANDVLQLKVSAAAKDLMRVVINTTFGVGGLFDVATEARLPQRHQDFGLTLGRWGMPSGPYLVLPLFGPSSIRDAAARAVDVKFNLLGSIAPAIRNPLYGVQFVSTRSDMLGATDLLSQAALDPYSFVRDAYLQQRQAAVHEDASTSDNAAPPALPDYGDPDDASHAQDIPHSATGSHGKAAAQGTAPAALPDYDDPGDAGNAGNAGNQGNTGDAGDGSGKQATSPSAPQVPQSSAP
jgi:phospholipid-binding lipoprotein MlaA